MEPIISFLTTLNSLSPLAVIALLGTVIFILVKGKTPKRLHEITTNHLHELPQMAADLREIAESIRRVEVKLTEDLSYLKARLNGRP